MSREKEQETAVLAAIAVLEAVREPFAANCGRYKRSRISTETIAPSSGT